MVIRKNVGKDGWALALCAGLGAYLIVAAACAGGDTPPRDAELEEAIQKRYDPDYATGAAGSVNMTGGSGGGGGSGAQGGSSAGGAGGGSSGTGGGSVTSGGSAGSGTAGSGSSLPPPTGPVCDAVAKVFPKCSFQPCHGDGSTNGSFADSEAAARALLDKPTRNTQCGKYIDSANPDASAILTKLDDPTCGGAQMPFNADPLSDEDIDCVRSWVYQF
ncbi:MAG: hypothetical protein ABI895_02450 [Deltaproteobacteria bacterium]